MDKIALLLLLVMSSVVALAQQVGRIDLVAGEVILVDAKSKTRSAKLGEPMLQGDTITTGKDGELHATLDDGSVLALRAATKMQIVQFQAKGKDSDTSIISLFSGALRSITGLIGRRNPNRVLLRTPTATIGIRGTDHETIILPAESNLGEAGTYDKVNAGGTRISSERGSIDVAPGQAGFAPPGRNPQLLANVPAFFKPTANEQRLEGINDTLHRGPGAAAGPAMNKGSTRIQGNTRINASASNVSATASGSENKAGNRIGTIGGE